MERNLLQKIAILGIAATTISCALSAGEGPKDVALAFLKAVREDDETIATSYLTNDAIDNVKSYCSDGVVTCFDEYNRDQWAEPSVTWFLSAKRDPDGSDVLVYSISGIGLENDIIIELRLYLIDGVGYRVQSWTIQNEEFPPNENLILDQGVTEHQ
jgi:hypothetical protein